MLSASVRDQCGAEFRNMRTMRAKKILLTQMTEVRAHCLGDGWVIIDDQTYVGPQRDQTDSFRQAPNLVQGNLLGAQLNQIGPALTKLLSDRCR